MPHHAAHHRARLVSLNKKQRKQLVRRSVLAVAIIEPLMTGPQIYQIWVEHEASGVSVASWSLFMSAAFVWLLYGLQLKDKPIIISSILWVVMEIPVVVGAVIYN